MSEDKKVVSLLDRKKDKEREAQNMPALPEEYREVLTQQEKDVEEIVNFLHESLSEFVKKRERPMDISIALDGLARVVAETSLELDKRVDTANLGEHYVTRDTMINSLISIIDQMVEQSETPVFTQDIYLILSNVLVQFINRYRYYQTISGQYNVDQSAVAEEQVADATNDPVH